jgi:hypothetical protein
MNVFSPLEMATKKWMDGLPLPPAQQRQQHHHSAAAQFGQGGRHIPNNGLRPNHSQKLVKKEGKSQMIKMVENNHYTLFSRQLDLLALKPKFHFNKP